VTERGLENEVRREAACVSSTRSALAWSAAQLAAGRCVRGASCAFVLVFATAGTPIPLYNIYQAQDGITKGGLGLVSAGYFVAAALALLVLGRLSNFLGRKPIAITALTCAAASCVLLLIMDGLTPLLLARVLQGLSCGLASGALGSYIVDSGIGRPRWLRTRSRA
jgi:MFS family permease